MNLKRFLSDSMVEKFYINSGAFFGDALSYDYLGKCIGFDHMLKKLINWEAEYSERGYRTITLENFIAFGGYGKPLNDLIGRKREDKEIPLFHAKEYANQRKEIL